MPGIIHSLILFLILCVIIAVLYFIVRALGLPAEAMRIVTICIVVVLAIAFIVIFLLPLAGISTHALGLYQ